MTDTTSTDSETDNNEKQPSDARIILGPLVKYAAMGFVLVSIIISTAVMLDRQFNNIDEEVAQLEAQLAQANMETETATAATEVTGNEVTDAVINDIAEQQPVVTEATAEADAAATYKPAEDSIASNVADTAAVPVTAAAPAAKQAVVTEPVAADSTVAENAVADNAITHNSTVNDDFFDQSFEEIIAQRNAYFREMDRIYLEEFKASRDKQLQLMRERLARQEQRISEIERRNREIYETRAANLREMQEQRTRFLPDRI